MKIYLDNELVFEITETMEKVLCNEMLASEFKDEVKRRLRYSIENRYEVSFGELKAQWEPKLAQRMDSIPTNPEKFAALVFSQPDYKDRETREK